MPNPISPALAPAGKLLPNSKPKKKTQPLPGDMFEGSYGHWGANTHALCTLDESKTTAEKVASMKNLLFAPWHKSYEGSPAAGHGLGTFMNEKEGDWYILPVLCRDNTKFHRPVVPFLRVDSLSKTARLVFVVHGNSPFPPCSTKRSIMYNLEDGYGEALAVNIRVLDRWVTEREVLWTHVDYQVRYVFECMKEIGLNVQHMEKPLLNKLYELEDYNKRGTSLLVLDNLSHENRSRSQSSVLDEVGPEWHRVHAKFCDAVRRASSPALAYVELRHDIERIAANNWVPTARTGRHTLAADTAVVTAVATAVVTAPVTAADTAAVTAPVTAPVTAADTAAVAATAPGEPKQSDTRVAGQCDEAECQSPIAKKRKRRHSGDSSESEEEMSDSGSDSGSYSDDDEEEEEEEEDSEGSDDENFEDDTSVKSVASSTTNPNRRCFPEPVATKVPPGDKHHGGGKAGTSPKLHEVAQKTFSAESSNAPGRVCQGRGRADNVAVTKKRKPAYNRRIVMASTIREILAQGEHLAPNMPSGQWERLKMKMEDASRSLVEYVNVGKKEEEQAHIIAAWKLVGACFSCLAKMGTRVDLPEPDAQASRRVAHAMNKLYEKDQPELEKLSTFLIEWGAKMTEMTCARARHVQEAERAASQLPFLHR